MVRKWHKTVTLFILLWAVLDLAVPSLCQAEDDFSFIPRQSSAVMSNSSSQSQPTSGATVDDCFCCSSHVAPTSQFNLLATAVREEDPAPDPVVHLLQYAESHYRPPRA
jgi:hypothetical protein